MKQAIFIVILIGLVSTSCKKDSTGIDENGRDTLRGIFGNISLYNQYGDEVGDFSGVSVRAYCVDTLANDSLGNVQVYDTLIETTTNERGRWALYHAPRGNYSFLFLKEGYGSYAEYSFWYDTVSADSLKPITLAQTPPATVYFDSVVYNQGLLNFTRTITFTQQYVQDYPVVTWYFFDTIPSVSVSQHIFGYMSGASFGNVQNFHNHTIQFYADNLRLYGFHEQDSVYVRIGLDNYVYSRYQDSTGVLVYPNVENLSEPLSFYLDSFYDE
ncbi:MAG: hypothetical protein PF481_05990 [Bacteroidales bacterium]|nr:hypothetical protein [Bacteroidales bacterium]